MDAKSDGTLATSIEDMLAQRFGERIAVDADLDGLADLAKIAGHRTHRRYLPRAVSPELIRLLCACALSAPSKSDLQQCDIVVVGDAATRNAIADKIPDMPWIGTAPAFLVFLANGQRLPFLAQWRDKPFPNDHLDAFFNAAVDAGIVLATFIRAATAVGLGSCPISAIRDHAGLREHAAATAGTRGPDGRSHARLAVGRRRHHRPARARHDRASGPLSGARSRCRSRSLRSPPRCALALSRTTQPGALGQGGV